MKKTTADYAATQAVRQGVRDQGIWTVCTEANCPNLSECWADRHCTFLILGNECTRWCGYCSVPKALRPTMQDFAPERAQVVRSIQELGATYVVLTSPNRDDLPLGGAEAWADQITAIHEGCPGVLVEVLLPDFDFDSAAWDLVQGAGVAVLSHNVEAVPSRYATVRPHGDFDRALGCLTRAKERDPEQITKTALICGLGETRPELGDAIARIAAAGIDILVLGQYLRPTPRQLPVNRFVPP
ncbi:MAG TPA: lipoyl synthase, partial [bacterium]|nr:lipoyl synthase [bacterium]